MHARLQKILSHAGIASRRAAEDYITQGRVSVNGTTITELGSKADPDTDDIRVDGRRLKTAQRRLYILMYKPRGYITSRSDPQRRPTVIDLLNKGGIREYVYPVGRLDYESEGLLLLTSDGELAAQLTHPSHGVGREYQVRVLGVPDDHDIERLARGIVIDGRRTAPAEISLVKVIEGSNGQHAVLSIVIHEGRNRQVRNMFEAVGHPVDRLRRVRIGPITDEHIRPGEFRELAPKEIAALKRAAVTPTPKRPAAPESATATKEGGAGSRSPTVRPKPDTTSGAGTRRTSPTSTTGGFKTAGSRPKPARAERPRPGRASLRKHAGPKTHKPPHR